MTSELEGIARVYGFWGRHPGWYRFFSSPTFLFRERFLRSSTVRGLCLAPGNQVLEVACGTGLNLPYLREAVGELGRVVGFDYSPEMLAAARETAKTRGWGNVELFQGDAAELVIPCSGFDGALCILGLSAIPDRRAALRRMYELLRTGGRISVCDAQPFRAPLGFLNPAVVAIYRATTGWDPKACIPSEIESVFGNVEIERFHMGAFYVATAVKR